MLVGIRKKHWLMFSLSLTSFLLLLVFTSKPITPPRILPGDGEVGFLRRRITHNSGQEAASPSPPAPPPPPPPPPEPRADPPQATSQRPHNSPSLTEAQRQALASQGVLLVEVEEPQQQQQQQDQERQEEQQQQQDEQQIQEKQQQTRQQDEQQVQQQQQQQQQDEQQEQIQARQLTEYNPLKQQQQQQQQQQGEQLQQPLLELEQPQPSSLPQQQQHHQQQQQQTPPQLQQTLAPQPPPSQYDQQQQPQQPQQQQQQHSPKQPQPERKQQQPPSSQQQQEKQQQQQQPQPQQQQQSAPSHDQRQQQQPHPAPPSPEQQPQQQQPQPQHQPHAPSQPRQQQQQAPGNSGKSRHHDKPRPAARPRPHLPPPHSAAAAAGGSEHDQWLKQVMALHQEYLRQQHRLSEHHHQETQRLQQKLQQQQEAEHQTARAPKSGSRASGRLLGRASAPKVTYDGLKRQGESAIRHIVKREFISTQRDTNFTPGEMVNPSQVRRVIVLSTWRSGSSYLGDLLRSYPGTFYSFEPLHHLLKNLHLEDGPLVERAQDLLRSILTCDYSQLDDYIAYMRNVTFLMRHNTRLWNSCALNRALCFDKDYLSRACSYMPVNVLKTVRLGLSPVVKLLEDETLDLRVVHLVRDPRGCLHSRMQLSWCQSPACRDPATVCQDLLTDLTFSDWLKKNHSDRYLMVRYEDLGLKPEEKAKEIFNFVGLSYNKYVSTYVKEHTTLYKKSKKRKDAYGTFRDSKATIFAWRGALDYHAVAAIQGVCEEPLQRLGLRMFSSEEDYLNTTIPVLLQE